MVIHKDYNDSIGDIYSVKKKKAANDIEDKDWLVTYSDIVTLLMAFFILMLSMSSVDQAKVEQFMQGVNKELLRKEKTPPFKELKEQLQSILNQKGLSREVEIGLDPKGINLQFSSNSIFESGSAEVRKKIRPVIKDICSSILNSISESSFRNYIIDVEGHTDNIPIHNEKFASNWELSSARATGVVRLFIENGIPAHRLVASGFSDSRPKVPNFNPDGTINKMNQAINRRVVIKIHKY